MLFRLHAPFPVSSTVECTVHIDGNIIARHNAVMGRYAMKLMKLNDVAQFRQGKKLLNP
jgi:hypothetical protein